jgi:hypothetical protein
MNIEEKVKGERERISPNSVDRRFNTWEVKESTVHDKRVISTNMSNITMNHIIFPRYTNTTPIIINTLTIRYPYNI